MMNNRDLLVNAARAAEIQGKYYIAYDERYINEGIDIGNGRLNCHSSVPQCVLFVTNVSVTACNVSRIILNFCQR
jgi:hypothetical protein